MALERLALGNISVVYERSVFDRRADLRDFAMGGALGKLAQGADKMIVALGGDGTLLRAVRAYSAEALPFLGVHFGNKGFLMTEPAWLSDEAEFATLDYPLLHNILSTEDGIVEFDSINDTVIRSVGPSLGNFWLSLDSLALDVACDGLIVSTPMGSTGYARAVGGSILPHSLPCLTVAPIAPFAPAGFRPVVCGDEACCRVEARTSGQNTLSVYSDAETIREGLSTATLDIRKSARTVRLLVPRSRLAEWRERTLVEQGFSRPV